MFTLPSLSDLTLTIGHKPDSDPYPKWNGVWAAQKWHELGATAFDCDVQISLDGTAWAIHWSDWWKHGIVTKPGASVPHLVISHLHDAQIRQLVHKDGWEINTVREVMEAAAPLGITLCLEAKSDYRFERDEIWKQIHADAIETGCSIVAMTIQDFPTQVKARARLAAAHAEGIPTLLLTRMAITDEWWAVLDGAKGSGRMVGKVPAGKVRLGASIASATKYGCSCGPTNAAAATKHVYQLAGKQVGLRIDGADISHHQADPLDFVLFAKAGGKFVYHKATEGSHFLDPKYVERQFPIRDAGLLPGAYHYAKPAESSGAEQATYFAVYANVQPGDMRPWLDLEDAGGLSRAELTAWVGEYVATHEAIVGCKPFIYDRNLALDDHFGCDLVSSRYNPLDLPPDTLPHPWTSAALHQFSDGVAGVPNSAPGLGHVDLDTIRPGHTLDALRVPTPEVTPVDTAHKVIAIARGEIGYHEGRSGGHWNNDEKYAEDVPGLAWANNQPWCDTFVAWCFWKAGALDLLPGGPTASTDKSRANAIAAGRWNEYPAVGAQVLFGTGTDCNHTGIVVSYGPNTITTVEGNTNTSGSPEGDGVYLKVHQRRDPHVLGYLYPTYPEGIDSADPDWHEKPKPTTAAPDPKPAPKPHHKGHVAKAVDELKIARTTCSKASLPMVEMALAILSGHPHRVELAAELLKLATPVGDDHKAAIAAALAALEPLL